MTDGAPPEQQASAFHHVGQMSFGEDGPDRLDVTCMYDDEGRFAGQWLVSVDIWEHEDLVDHDNPVQWDAERDEQLPEACWNMPPQQARKLAALIVKAAEHAELFQDMP